MRVKSKWIQDPRSNRNLPLNSDERSDIVIGEYIFNGAGYGGVLLGIQRSKEY